MKYDVVIVGGGPGGLAAALTLGRARKRVLLCDAGPKRNAAAAHIQNFVTRDGTAPAEFRKIGRQQLAATALQIYLLTKESQSMKRSLTAVLSAALGGACSSTPSRPVASPGNGGSGEHKHKHQQGQEHQHRHEHEHGTHAFTDAESWAKVFDDPARDEWQRPDDVVRALELEPTMTVADIGAGTGYFAVRLARAVPKGKVIATDIEPDMVRFLNERATRDGLANLQGVPATQTNSGLAPQSVDRILIVNVWHHLDDHVAYARHLASTLRPGGKVFIVEFSSAADRGPPANMRLAPEALIAELTTAGLTAKLSSLALPEQYIVEAHPSLPPTNK